MKVVLLCCLFVGWITLAYGQSADRNVVLITLDGFRWQELFTGADSTLLYNKLATTDERVSNIYWNKDSQIRRELLMPFFWSEIRNNGQLLGNREFGNTVDCDNPHWFSYPGYNEMLTGFVDRRIRSNDAVANPDMTVLEFLNQHPAYRNSVAAFGTWGVFPYILREDKSGIPVNAGSDAAVGDLSERELLLNELQQLMPNPVTERHDVFTMYFAMEYMKREHPKVVFIGLDETDSYAHGGKYDEYLKAANRSDALIKKLWGFVQSDPQYRDNTTFIITTDHGRGRWYRHDKMNWRSHGRLAFGSGQVWVAAMGPSVPALGEVKTRFKGTLSQVASTLSAVVGVRYLNERSVAEPFKTILPANQGVLAHDAANVYLKP
jgi:Metalloenzyme superfamily